MRNSSNELCLPPVENDPEHLEVMKAAGIIKGEVDGPRVCYCLSPRALRRLEALVGGL